MAKCLNCDQDYCGASVRRAYGRLPHEAPCTQRDDCDCQGCQLNLRDLQACLARTINWRERALGVEKALAIADAVTLKLRFDVSALRVAVTEVKAELAVEQKRFTELATEVLDFSEDRLWRPEYEADEWRAVSGDLRAVVETAQAAASAAQQEKAYGDV